MRLRSTFSTGKYSSNRDQDDGSNSCCRNAVKQASSANIEFRENPAAENGAHHAKDDVGYATKAAAARDGSGQPAGDQADDHPSDHGLGNVERKDVHGGLLSLLY